MGSNFFFFCSEDTILGLCILLDVDELESFSLFSPFFTCSFCVNASPNFSFAPRSLLDLLLSSLLVVPESDGPFDGDLDVFLPLSLRDLDELFSELLLELPP